MLCGISIAGKHRPPRHTPFNAKPATGVPATGSVEYFRKAEDGIAVAPNCVYTYPPGRPLSIRQGRLVLGKPTEGAHIEAAIDHFLASLAEDQGNRAVCIMLSGSSGLDGPQGVRAVRTAGGMCMAQEPDTAEFPAMPQAVIETGLVDYVLKPSDMPAALVDFSQHQEVFAAGQEEPADEAAPSDIDAILKLLRTRTNSDYSHYKRTTVFRRIQRRMGLRQIENTADYVKLLQTDAAELAQLAKDMLIGVSSFFRDAEVFDALRTEIVIPLIEARKDDSPVRVWVAGCATGEEAYSISMLLLEERAAADKSFPVQVFATDIDERALETARAGTYAPEIANHVSSDRLERFFTVDDEGYHVEKHILDMAGGTLSAKLRRAIKSALQQEEPVRLAQVSMPPEGSPLANLTVLRVGESGDGDKLLAVVFEDAQPQRHPPTAHTVAPEDEPLVAQLEAEVNDLRAELRSNVEGYDAATEELKAANEEVMSMNEELQSANEELEASKEELQSVNEELTTVNAQLNDKVGELTDTNNDLANLLKATEIATIFLDAQLRIRRFTPRSTELLNLIESDLGRPIAHITQNFAGGDLAADAEKVLKTLSPIEKEVRARDGLARVLHDNLQQLLVAGKFQLSAVRSSASDERALEAVDLVDDLLTQSLDASRALTVELSPTILYEGGLEANAGRGHDDLSLGSRCKVVPGCVIGQVSAFCAEVQHTAQSCRAGR